MMNDPIAIIPAPTEPVTVDLTAWAIGIGFALGIAAAIGAVPCCLSILKVI